MTLKDSYINTDYIVFIPNRKITLNIGIFNQDWEYFLHEIQKDFYFYITAYNPYSKLKTEKENEDANKSLIQRVKSIGLQYYDGIGISKDGNWSENSICVVGGDERIAIDLGNTFKQNAIVWGHKFMTPELVVLCDF